MTLTATRATTDRPKSTAKTTTTARCSTRFPSTGAACQKPALDTSSHVTRARRGRSPRCRPDDQDAGEEHESTPPRQPRCAGLIDRTPPDHERAHSCRGDAPVSPWSGTQAAPKNQQGPDHLGQEQPRRIERAGDHHQAEKQSDDAPGDEATHALDTGEASGP